MRQKSYPSIDTATYRKALARPWANMLWEYTSGISLQSQCDIERHLEQLSTIVKSSTIDYALLDPSLDTATRHTLIVDLYNKRFPDALPEVVSYTVKQMLTQGEGNLVPELAEHYNTLKRQLHNIDIVSVTTARVLTNTQRQEVQEILEAKLKNKSEFAFRTDPSLIEGLVIKVNDNCLDMSWSHELTTLKVTDTGELNFVINKMRQPNASSSYSLQSVQLK